MSGVYVSSYPYYERRRLNHFSHPLWGGVTGNRTRDTRIFSPLLYQLSYDTVLFGTANIASFFDSANFSFTNTDIIARVLLMRHIHFSFV